MMGPELFHAIMMGPPWWSELQLQMCAVTTVHCAAPDYCWKQKNRCKSLQVPDVNRPNQSVPIRMP